MLFTQNISALFVLCTRLHVCAFLQPCEVELLKTLDYSACVLKNDTKVPFRPEDGVIYELPATGSRRKRESANSGYFFVRGRRTRGKNMEGSATDSSIFTQNVLVSRNKVCESKNAQSIAIKKLNGGQQKWTAKKILANVKDAMARKNMMFILGMIGDFHKQVSVCAGNLGFCHRSNCATFSCASTSSHDVATHTTPLEHSADGQGAYLFCSRCDAPALSTTPCAAERHMCATDRQMCCLEC